MRAAPLQRGTATAESLERLPAVVVAPALEPAFVGRDGELIALRSALDLVRDGEPRIVLVAGEAGVGKSRLVAELARLAEAEGVSVYEGGCIDLSTGAQPYGPFLEALHDPLAESAADPRNAKSDLRRLGLGPGPAPLEDVITGAVAQTRVFELLLNMLLELSGERPVLLLLEDLHWADSSTLDLLSFAQRNLRGAVLLVGTFRTDELEIDHPAHEWLVQFRSRPRGELLELTTFSRAQVAEQIAAVRGQPADEALVEQVFAQSDGNAFHVEELLAQFADGPAGARTKVPRHLADLLLLRMRRLSADAQAVLRLAATAGLAVTHELIAAATELPLEPLLRGLREAVERHVLVVDDDGAYRFRHALMREAIYDDLLPGERMVLHRQCAEALDVESTMGGGMAAALAYHWRAAGDRPRALAAVVVAGQAALSVLAYGEAWNLLEEAHRLWQLVPAELRPTGVDEADLVAGAADAARWRGEFGTALNCMQQALGLLAEDDVVRRGVFLERLGRYHWQAHQPTESLLAYERARETLAPVGGQELARVLAAEAGGLMLLGRYAESRLAAEQAVQLARRVGARQEEGHALNTLGVAMVFAGETDEGLRDLGEALSIAEDEREGDLEDLLRACANLSFTLGYCCQLDEAARIALRGLEVARRHGVMDSAGPVMAENAVSALVARGRWDEASEILQAISLPGSDGLGLHLAFASAEVEIARGEFALADEHLRMAETGTGDHDFQFHGQVSALRAEAAIWAGDPEAAREWVRSAVDHAGSDPQLTARLCWLGIRGAADAAARARTTRQPGLVTEAQAEGRRLLEICRNTSAANTSVGPCSAQAWSLLPEVEFERLAERPDPERWQQVAEAWYELGQPYPVAYACWRQAQALHMLRQRMKAGPLLRRAYELASELGATPLIAEVQALARAARVDLQGNRERNLPARASGVPPARSMGLTVRELQVLLLLGDGSTNRQIARQLGMMEKTASVHVSRILVKLNVTNRSQAAASARHLGLV